MLEREPVVLLTRVSRDILQVLSFTPYRGNEMGFLTSDHELALRVFRKTRKRYGLDPEGILPACLPKLK